MKQGDVVWVDLGEPVGSEAGFDRPVVVVQSNVFNRSRIGTVVIVPLSTSPNAVPYPGNVVLPAKSTGLPHASTATVAHVRSLAVERLGPVVGHLTGPQLTSVLRGLALVLGLGKQGGER